MLSVEYFFGFHAPKGLREDPLRIWGHVEAWGYTLDDTWWFFDPGRRQTQIIITHQYEEVNQILACKFDSCREILSIKSTEKFRRPLHMPMTCATQCSALIGIRAFTPEGFRRKLLARNAEVIHGPQ